MSSTPTWQILQADVREGLRSLPADSVQCVVTSPPYWGLRNYGVDGQIGHEPTPDAFVCTLVDVFREVRRVLRPDGVCFVNLGDSYAGSGKGPSNSLQPDASQLGSRHTGQFANGQAPTEWMPIPRGLKAKDLCLIPERFAIGMQEDGWWVRSRIAWCKQACMPESVQDRPTNAWEHIWLFAKSSRYFWDADAVRVPTAPASIARNNYRHRMVPEGAGPETYGVTALTGNMRSDADVKTDPNGRNLWSYWLLGPEPLSMAHFATFPTEIPRICISAGSSERGCCPTCGAPWRRVVERTPSQRVALTAARSGVAAGWRPTDDPTKGNAGLPNGANLTAGAVTTGWQPSCSCPEHQPIPQTILDPFAGSGTTLMVALRLGRSAIGVELNPEYVELARKRINGDAPMFNAPAEVK